MFQQRAAITIIPNKKIVLALRLSSLLHAIWIVALFGLEACPVVNRGTLIYVRWSRFWKLEMNPPSLDLSGVS